MVTSRALIQLTSQLGDCVQRLTRQDQVLAALVHVLRYLVATRQIVLDDGSQVQCLNLFLAAALDRLQALVGQLQLLRGNLRVLLYNKLLTVVYQLLNALDCQ